MKFLEMNLYVESKTETKPFLTYHTFDKNNKKWAVKFTQSCKDVPETDCRLVVEDTKLNFDSKRKYPCFWVKEIASVKDLEVKARDYSDMFDVVEDD